MIWLLNLPVKAPKYEMEPTASKISPSKLFSSFRNLTASKPHLSLSEPNPDVNYRFLRKENDFYERKITWKARSNLISHSTFWAFNVCFSRLACSNFILNPKIFSSISLNIALFFANSSLASFNISFALFKSSFNGKIDYKNLSYYAPKHPHTLLTMLYL